MWSTTGLEFRCLDFWTAPLEGDEGRRAGNALGLGCVPGCLALTGDAAGYRGAIQRVRVGWRRPSATPGLARRRAEAPFRRQPWG